MMNVLEVDRLRADGSHIHQNKPSLFDGHIYRLLLAVVLMDVAGSGERSWSYRKRIAGDR